MAKKAAQPAPVAVDTNKKGWKAVFLSALAKSPLNAGAAAKACDKSRTLVYRERENDDAFRLAWDDIVEARIDQAEEDLERISRPGSDKHQNIGALIFLLKSRRRELYAEAAGEFSGGVLGAVTVSVNGAPVFKGKSGA